MVRTFPLAPLEKIARKAGAERVSVSAVKAVRDAVLDMADKIAMDAIAASRHAKRVTIKAEDITIASRRR